MKFQMFRRGNRSANMQIQIKSVFDSLFAENGAEMVPATGEDLAEFRRKARKRGVPASVVEELCCLYEVTNGVPCLNGFDLHRCDDEILFEYWSERCLWLGQYNDDMLRWANRKFCLGDASNISYSEADEFPTLIDLLKAIFRG